MDIELKEHLCLSGGAIGADLAWGKAALEAGHGLIHWSFSTHKPKDQKQFVIQLNSAQLREADDNLIQANEFVKRKFPSNNEHVNNLLRRNWYQVRDSASCYAVSKILDGMVDGGTAWAVALFLLKNDFNACPCFVYCQVVSSWHEWNGSAWTPITAPPRPKNIYAGVGSRDLFQNGAEAITKLYL